MSYSVVISPPVVQQVGERTYRTWIIEETSAGPGDAFTISSMPTYCVLTLFESQIVGEPNEHTTSPELLVGVPPALRLVVSAAEPRSAFRIQASVRMFVDANRLTVRSNVSGASERDVTTRITVVDGHL